MSVQYVVFSISYIFLTSIVISASTCNLIPINLRPPFKMLLSVTCETLAESALADRLNIYILGQMQRQVYMTQQSNQMLPHMLPKWQPLTANNMFVIAAWLYQTNHRHINVTQRVLIPCRAIFPNLRLKHSNVSGTTLSLLVGFGFIVTLAGGSECCQLDWS